MTRSVRRVLGFVLAITLIGSWIGCSVRTVDSSAQQAGAYQPLEVTTAGGVTMVLLPGGTFAMGSTNGAADEAPVHDVALGPFAIDKFEVTQDQFAALEIPDPSHFKDPRRPVEQVRWSDAALFCNLRSDEEGLAPCYDEITFACDFEASGYRLPTEAEWEYAARAGNAADPPGGDGEQLRSVACYAGNSRKKTDVVGKKKPNAWGIHDMQGNVLEWCYDVYGADYYGGGAMQDPRGPQEGKKRILRGGSWNSGGEACRVSTRFADVPGITDACFARDTYGFRCVRRLTDEEAARRQPPLAAH